MLTGDIHVWQINLNDASHAFTMSETLLSEEERKRAQQFIFSVHRTRFVLARAFLRVVLSRYVGVPAATISFGYTAAGKPYLAPNTLDLRFNLSHADCRAVCAVTHGCEVGIDIERLRVVPDACSVAARFISRRECDALEATAEAARDESFLTCWTRKEAYVKGRGLGLMCALDGFDVSLSRTTGNALLATRIEEKDERWWVHDVAVGPGFVCSLAVQGHTLAALPTYGRSMRLDCASASICARVQSIGKYSPRTAGSARFENNGECACSD